tara:strand:+ start:439 stop:1188 length:750 start_codon:yes stop_codon:yes gene_type:complete
MKFKLFLVIFTSLFLSNCETTNQDKTKVNLDLKPKYRNSGFALIYNNSLSDIKKLEDRSLNIYHKTLKKRSQVKITNPINGNSVIAEVISNKINFSPFYNSILSARIAEELDLDLNEPYIEIISISKNSMFVAKKAKTFDEERSVAEKAPIDGILINDLNSKTKKKKKVVPKDFSYSIKVADFYYLKTAEIMMSRIKEETSLNKLKIIKLSPTKYRVLIGPYSDIKTLKKSFDKMNILNFENLEILKNV